MTKTKTDIAPLRRALQQQLVTAKKMIGLCEAQTEALVDDDVDRLMRLERELRAYLERQEALDAERVVHSRELAWALGLETVPALAGLLPLLPAKDQETLGKLRADLLAAYAELELLKARNLHLLENGLEYAQFSLDLLSAVALQPAAYGTNLAAVQVPVFYVDSKA